MLTYMSAIGGKTGKTAVKNIFCKKGSILSLMILHRFKNSTCRMAAEARCLP